VTRQGSSEAGADVVEHRRRGVRTLLVVTSFGPVA